MKVPDKIYLFKNPITETPDDRWLSQRSDENDIEYTRTNVIAKKIEDWFVDVENGTVITDVKLFSEDLIECLKIKL